MHQGIRRFQTIQTICKVHCFQARDNFPRSYFSYKSSNVSPLNPTSDTTKALLEQYRFKITSHHDRENSIVFTTIIAQHKLASSLALWDPNIQESITDENDHGETIKQNKNKKPTLDLKSAIQAILLKYEEIKSPHCKYLEDQCNQKLNQDVQKGESISPSTAYIWFSNHLNEWYSEDKSKIFSHFINLSDIHLYFSAKGLSSMPFLASTIIQSSPAIPLLYYESSNDNFPSQIDYSHISERGLYLCFSSQHPSISDNFFLRLCKMCINANSVLMKPRSMYASHSIQLLKNQNSHDTHLSIEKKLEKCPYKEFITKNFSHSDSPQITSNLSTETIQIDLIGAPENSNMQKYQLSSNTWNSCSMNFDMLNPTSYPFISQNIAHTSAENSPHTCIFFTEVKGNCGIFIPHINPLENIPLISALLYEKSLDPISFDPELADHIFEPDVSQKSKDYLYIETLMAQLKNTRSKEMEEMISHEILETMSYDQIEPLQPNSYKFIQDVPIYLLNSPIMPHENSKLQLYEPRYRKLFKHSILKDGHFGWIPSAMLNEKRGIVGVYLKIESFGFAAEDYKMYVMVKAIGRFILGRRNNELSVDPINFGLIFHDIYLFDDDNNPHENIEREAWVQLGLQIAKERHSNASLNIKQLSFLIQEKSAQLFLNSTSIHARLKAIILGDLSDLAATSVFNRTNLPHFYTNQ